MNKQLSYIDYLKIEIKYFENSKQYYNSEVVLNSIQNVINLMKDQIKVMEESGIDD